MPQPLSSEVRDKVVLELYEKLLEIEQRLIPTGLHVFGHPAEGQQLSDVLCTIASFDRPEMGVRSLPDLVACGYGWPGYQSLLSDSATSDETFRQRAEVESTVREAIEMFLAGPSGSETAANFLAEKANVPSDESVGVFGLLARIREQLAVNHELDALMRALRGEYIEPGPGADIVQNPGILPTGRNTYAVNPYAVPSALAFRKAETTATALLERHRSEQGRYPQTIAMVLWGMDNIKTQGEGVAQALWLLGVEPRRDGMNRVVDVEAIPLERLGRPRIDVVMTVSGIFRDLFGATMTLLDKAVREVAQLDEPAELNFVKKHVDEQTSEGHSFDDGVIRVFSNAPGNYGANVDFMVLDSQWETADELGDLFVTRKCFAYGRNAQGRQARELMDRALSRVEVTYQNIDSIEVGITDVDHYFEYLGGVTQAVAQRSGKRPSVYLSDAVMPQRKIRSLEETIHLETRTKTLNPKWYEGMLKHGYSGVAHIEQHVANTFGWSATAQAVDDWVYDQIASTYVLDETFLDRLRSLNPDSTRNLVSRLLEANGRGYWQADESVIEQLQDVYSGLEDQFEGVAQ